MPFPVLKLLSPDEFRSGEEISRALGVSRASVHNLVERARELGVVIQAVRGKGYRLAERYSWLAPERLAAPMAGSGYKLLLHEQVSSTNSLLLDMAQQGQSHKSVLAAEWQSQGRGRRGRTWWAPLGSGLTFSLLWRFQRPLTALSGLSLVVGLALARSFRSLGVEGVAVKWPNDILVRGRKLAGILIETHGDMLSAATAVIGIGVNVRTVVDASGGKDFQPVAVEDVLGVAPDRNEVLVHLLSELDTVLKTFDSHGFMPFVEEWEALHAWRNQPVRVIGVGGQSILEGVALGVDETGVLRLNTADGIRLVHSGEVSLRSGIAS
jgi:BirA family biotin operon repressor/biotin-[acetyl-CoA-carboxylase] ligase